MPTQKSVLARQMSKREFLCVTLAVVTILLTAGWMSAYQVGVMDGRAMPKVARFIPPTEFAQFGMLGTHGEAFDRAKWSEVLLYVEPEALLADRIEDSEEKTVAFMLRPGV